MKRACLFLLLIFVLGGARASAAPLDLKSLVEAERAFAALSEAKGIRAAFLANLAPDSIVFRPTPVPGRTTYEGRTEIPGRLSWRPTYADISRAGDLGFTTGPYEMRPAGTAGQPAPGPTCGHYVSLWRVEPDGRWKVVIDVGTAHPCPAKPEPDLGIDMVWMPPPPDTPAGAKGILAILLETDRALVQKAWLDALAEDVRIYRPGKEPTVGRAAASKLPLDQKEAWAWSPMDGGIARSSDFGYTYGTLKSGKSEYAYFRVWRKTGGAWKIVLDLLSPAA